MEATFTHPLVPRQSSDSGTGINTGNPALDKLLQLLQNGFQLKTTAIEASLISSVAIAAGIIVLFCFIRPLNNVVYAPRAKYADAKHVPPPMAKNPLGWVGPIMKTKELQLAELVGLDATIFLRFGRMNRYIFSILTLLGCGIIIPINLIASKGEVDSGYGTYSPLMKITPLYVTSTHLYWGYVVLAYLFDIVICGFLWWNYRAVLRLRRNWFDSAEYQHSLAARTLLMMEIPKDLRSDQGIIQIAEETMSTPVPPKAAIARNVKELPELVEEHTKTVEQLEGVLAKYLKNPNNLPSSRPTCKMHKRDAGYQSGKKVDAIEYLTNRIQHLEREVKETRQSVDSRNAMSYGFASYGQIDTAHAVAYAGRKKAPRGTIVRMAPKPHDLLWQNLSMSKGQRKRANFVNNLWVALLTALWIIPNLFSAVFIANLSNLGYFWKGFQHSLDRHPTWWGIVQGIVAPALQSLFYFFLPAIFRRLSIKSGDVTKTSRDRHVLHKLFAFFVFNNLIVYSLFGALWTYIAAVVNEADDGQNVYDALKSEFKHYIMLPLETMSTFWLTWLIQRNLGAALDLAQLVNLAWGSFSRKYLSPTPRELIKLSAPQPFDYAGYYNYFLFYGIVALCWSPIQPLVLPVTAIYFWLDSQMKKYLLMYVFITKTESGGKFWRVLFNRMIFSALVGNAMILLVVIVQGTTWAMPIAMAPLPFLVIGFKYYCARTFDDKLAYYTTRVSGERDVGEQKNRGVEKVGVKFGNPVLYKQLITPMVHSKAQHLLKSIYTGRTSMDEDEASMAGGYSDMYMNPMARDRPGKKAKSDSPFELVDDSELDFSNFKNRADFRDEAGGDGELYGHSGDTIRRGSGTSTIPDLGFAKAAHNGTRSDSVSSERIPMDGSSTYYPSGYHAPPALRNQSPDSYSNRSYDQRSGSRGREGSYDDTHNNLIGGAARMGRSPPPNGAQYRSGSQGPPIRGWQMGDGYTPGSTATPMEETSYDYFRGRR